MNTERVIIGNIRRMGIYEKILFLVLKYRITDARKNSKARTNEVKYIALGRNIQIIVARTERTEDMTEGRFKLICCL